MTRRERIAQIDRECDSLQDKLTALKEQRNRLMLEQRKEDHPCPCVKLNGDIGIYNIQQQELENRNALSLGMVSQCLSADRACSSCLGTGKPGQNLN